MVLKVARMIFPGPVHFGEQWAGMESSADTVRSDTLYSAILWTWQKVHGDASDLVRRFLDRPPFLLSSAFPFMEDRYYLPRPYLAAPEKEKDGTGEISKDWKKVRWVTRDSFRRWCASTSLDRDGAVKEDREIRARIIPETVPRVALGRSTSKSQLFSTGTVRFKERAGLYIILKAESEILDRLEGCLRILGELGIGGERTYGFGRFHLDGGQFADAGKEWDGFGEQGTGIVSLSLVYPSPEEMPSLETSARGYGLVERRGWFSTPGENLQFKRKVVTMFTEGSVFEPSVRGSIVDVTPSTPAYSERQGAHPIYRFGLAFPFPRTA